MHATPRLRIKCPHCGRTATTMGRFFVLDMAGPVERPRLRCAAGHWLAPLATTTQSRWADTPDLAVGQNPSEWKPR